MAYQSVWWLPHNHNYRDGFTPGRTWPQTMTQYYKPRWDKELRHYYLPTETYSKSDMLFYTKPTLNGVPKYRGTFRDKPWTVDRHYPEAVMDKPVGFHGRQYYEHGRPQFKYDGPYKDDLRWLEYCPENPPPSQQRTRDMVNSSVNLPHRKSFKLPEPTDFGRAGPPSGLTTASRNRERLTPELRNITDSYRELGLA